MVPWATWQLHEDLRKSDLSSDTCQKSTHLLSRVQLFATPRTVARQAPLSMGFSKQEAWRGYPFPSPKGASQPRD